MTPESRTFLGRLMGLVIFATAMVSCSTASVGPGGRISKVKYYHLIPGLPQNSEDPAIKFERDYHLYGAVTKADVIERGGHYYDVFWKVIDRTQPVTVRFEYRQANSGLTTKSLEQEISEVHRGNITKFQITGAEYNVHGRVTAWRVSLVRGKEVLVSQESYLWN